MQQYSVNHFFSYFVILIVCLVYRHHYSTSFVFVTGTGVQICPAREGGRGLHSIHDTTPSEEGPEKKIQFFLFFVHDLCDHRTEEG